MIKHVSEIILNFLLLTRSTYRSVDCGYNKEENGVRARWRRKKKKRKKRRKIAGQERKDYEARQRLFEDARERYIAPGWRHDRCSGPAIFGRSNTEKHWNVPFEVRAHICTRVLHCFAVSSTRKSTVRLIMQTEITTNSPNASQPSSSLSLSRLARHENSSKRAQTCCNYIDTFTFFLFSFFFFDLANARKCKYSSLKFPYFCSFDFYYFLGERGKSNNKNLSEWISLRARSIFRESHLRMHIISLLDDEMELSKVYRSPLFLLTSSNYLIH